MIKALKFVIATGLALALAACGTKVEVPPAHVGKIMTKSGYVEGMHGTSNFRLSPCMAYCDKLVLLNVADQANTENMEIFIPEDKLKLTLSIRTNLVIADPVKQERLFSQIAPTTKSEDGVTSVIERDVIYKTYAQQIILTETREYLSQFSISQIASSLEKVNAELRARLSKSLKERTPFDVRYVGITDISYPKIITDAQENAARRREQIQQEEAQREISKVTLERELQEAQLQRRIDVEKAQADAEADATRSRAITADILKIRQLENDREWINKWDGKLPTTTMGNATPMVTIPQGK